MNRVRRAYEFAAVTAVVAAFAAGYLTVVTSAPPSESPASYWTTALALAVPMSLWILAALLVVGFWWERAGPRLSTLDPPARLLATAVATLPEHRRDWGAAMTAELGEVQGRAARWGFALSGARAAVRLPHPAGWPALAVAAGLAAAVVAAAGWGAGAAVPGLGSFTAVFVGILGALVVLAVARSRRPRLPVLVLVVKLPVPAVTVLVTAGVAASLAVTVTTVHLDLREPASARIPSLGGGVLLATVLAICLWVAVAPPRWLVTERLPAHLGVAGALAYAGFFLFLVRWPGPADGLYLLGVWLAPVAAFAATGFVAGAVRRSFNSGVRAGVWTTVAVLPIGFAVLLFEGLRRYSIERTVLGADAGVRVGATLSDAIGTVLLVPLIGFPFAVIGAAFGALLPRRRAPEVRPVR